MSHVVIGGGLGGLATAAYLARAGLPVTLIEKSSELGGRARTTEVGRYRLNLGPHALYLDGAAKAALAQLGIDPPGRLAAARGAYALRDGALHTLPVGLLSLLSTGLLPLAGKLALGRALAAVPRLNVEPLRGRSFADWVAELTPRDDVRAVLYASARVATYSNAPELVDAAAVVRQLQRALRTGVRYCDGGWQAIVDQLRDAAVAAGARVIIDARAERVEPGAVRLAGGRALPAASVTIAASPASAGALLGATFTATPVRAACLDVALRALPVPRAVFALGIDEPTYFSVHSAYAKLAPEHGAVMHVARYLAPDEPAGDRAGLERVLDLLQPGWRDALAHARFLPSITVAHDLPRADRAAIDRGDGTYLVGDWVGDDGMLADASLASARRAAELIAARAGAELHLAA